MTQIATYQPGAEIDIDGTAIILCRRKGSTGIRWTWLNPETNQMGEAYQATPEAAIDHARRALGNLCGCGNVATMTASTRRTCVDCYDRHAD
ncbi:hypothetical protein Drose_05905 [Dactylosporangium roseum]|uniref:Uncharacterized protein n=1 Tax=Dactylosporangium roseum TaxID=47989 RepID=A0ABY5Z6X9_9ACTN|nr:hypothetical protein [Dactylosporangium roseum]UWZ37805.1 hypothetical protein Drose_05905 [Dactylosporangium roseum]